VLEPIIGFILCGVVVAATWAYMRWWHVEAKPDIPFEKWAATRPMLAALRCPPGRSVDALYLVRQRLGAGEFVNPDGGWPWQHYIVTLEAWRPNEDVVGLRLVGLKRSRGKATRPPFGKWFMGLGPLLGTNVSTVWLHGKVRHTGSLPAADRERVSWAGRFDGGGKLGLQAMIGLPPWVSDTKAA
jgi:hypothetical protein